MIRSKIINFEWMCDYNHFNFEKFNKIKFKLVTDEINIAIDKKNINTVIGLFLIDGFLPLSTRDLEFQKFLSSLDEYFKEKDINCFLISGQGENLENSPFEYFFYDTNLRFVYNDYKNRLDKISNFNRSSKKFLFLTGVPSRPNRIGLLSKFYEKNIIKDSIWTFFPPWTTKDKKWCRSYLSHYSNEKYKIFLKLCERKLDEKYDTAQDWLGDHSEDNEETEWGEIRHTKWAKHPVYVDSSVYNETRLSVISEGPNYWGGDWEFITEKTWRTFLHKHPFVFAGHPDQFDYIKQLGFRTFENFLPIPDYAYIQKEDERLEAVVANTEFLLSNREYDNEIQEDIDYNYYLFFEWVKKQDNFVNNLVKNYGVDREEFDYWIGKQTGYNNLIMEIPRRYYGN